VPLVAFSAPTLCLCSRRVKQRRRIETIAYDEELAARIRDLVSGEHGIEEKKMFGGLAFLLDGNMAVAASGQGGLLARVDPAKSDKLAETTPAEEMVMRGRPMSGWLRLDSTDVEGDELDVWVERGLAFARSLPAKR
jgi:TfoX/Sxy family transcriptional regulator of competence genes